MYPPIPPARPSAFKKRVQSIVFLAALTALLWPPLAARATDKILFESHIRPILREYCLDCHGASDSLEGSLDLRLVRWMISGGDSGAAIEPGNSQASLLLERIISGDMPPGESRVSPEKIELIRNWIDQGAATIRPEPDSLSPGIPITEEERAYWAYQPLKVPSIQAFSSERVRTPLDQLIVQAMPHGLSLSPDADRLALILRLHNDLIGLPPSREELQQWLRTSDTQWYDQLVDHLLASPHYGERWARHWLDWVGYADSDGFTLADAERPWAWRYRDYIIRSLNQDKPFDQFIIEQLAGDELAGAANGDWTEQQIELLTATGFLRMAADGTGSGDNSPEARNKTIADTLQIIGSTLLASSMNCAQCHDHRYDPLSQHDYTALRAIFEPAMDWQSWKTPGERLVSLTTAAERQLAGELEQQAQKIAVEREQKQSEFMKQALEMELAKHDEPLRGQLRVAYETAADSRTSEQKALLDKYPSVNISPGVLYQYLPQAAEELKKIDGSIAEIRAKKPAESYVQALVEPAGHLPATKLYYRGDHNQPKHEVAPGCLSVLSVSGTTLPLPTDDPQLETSGRRLAFAKWLTNADTPNPLFVRSMINRVWLHHFGRGIVSTPGDFGKLGSPPSHPEILDWLGYQWIEDGWSLKWLHKLIVSSTVYRQSSQRNAQAQQIDPENLFYWHKPLMRVDAEVLRDSMLAISGELKPELFGPPIPIEEDDTGQVRIPLNQPRRSLYAKWRRTQPVAMLQSFDAPVMQVNCDARSLTTVATQSLLLMNNDIVIDQATKIARRAEEVAKSTVDSNLELTVKLPPAPEPVWKYGTASLDAATQRVSQFIPLTHFESGRWQGGPTLPDSLLGWVSLTVDGGHPGNASYPAVRRWIAPASGRLTISGSLSHGSEHGDGVRARIFHGSNLYGPWSCKTGSVSTEAEIVEVRQGDAVDFYLDCIEHETSDSFAWPVTLVLDNEQIGQQQFQSNKGFQGPPEDYQKIPEQLLACWQLILHRQPTQTELDSCVEFAKQQLMLLQNEPNRIIEGSSPAKQVLTSICQTLLGSNEFLYIE